VQLMIALVIAGMMASRQGFALDGAAYLNCRDISDGCFVSGMIFTGMGMLLWVSSTGFFDIFGYAMKSLLVLFSPLKKPGEHPHYYEYKCEKEEKRKGKPITDESSRSILEALWKLYRFEEVEALCDDIIANNKNRAATAHSRLLKGILLAMRYDKDFIGYIYDAIDINSNYVEEGLNVIGEYCCKMGLQKELDEYRERSVILAQSNIDEFSKLNDLLPTDNVMQDDMDKEMLDSILKYFESISENSISRIYLVKKVINENFFGSCFIIRFKEGSPEAVVMRVMDKIFNHLDTHESERHFSLFYYGVQYAPVIAKVENSCVWDIADKM
jgi:hypothetical protein